MEHTPPDSHNHNDLVSFQNTQEITVDNNLPNPPAVTALVTPPAPNINNIGLATSSSTEDIPPPKADYYAPPPYEVATKGTKLPTYEEVQREKHLEEQDIPINSPTARPLQYRQPGQRVLTIESENPDDVDTSLLGTDFMFYIAFFVAFIFNWIGFLLLMCFCHTIASRYGALSGFGLSLAKWTFIVQHSTELASKDNSWLWWLIMTFGKFFLYSTECFRVMSYHK
ncbi:hypothetical protein NQ314_001868 [Rhamnusium bicolor]|uniref:NEDD4 family-interacting protein 1-like n=1 Tax=Rhamnusium bicolor TaxID=1586634 RepID=A0AAV8ZT72_9CUCU|nr:hypothetical protein NQ314_001868 [Rhamnusium bicolor]